MGNNAQAKEQLGECLDRVESKVGKMPVSGRYHRHPRKLEDDYEVTTKVLGSGYNGVVRMGVNKTSKNQKVAVKAFKFNGVYGEKWQQLQNEVEIFLIMDHPHVTRLFDVYEHPEHLHLVMECMEGGELFDRVTELKQFSERDAADSVWQMLLSLNYIHSHNIVHRDLKLENFLFDQKNSSHLKLIDFGFSKVWEPNIKMHVSCGTLSYVAPEVLEKNYGSQCDLWSLGVITFILLSGYMPFSGTEAAQTANISQGKYRWKQERWKNVSELGVSFVKELLVLQPAKRLTAQTALDHKWIEARNKHGPTEMDKTIVDALQSFGHASKFRRASMEMMAWSLSNEERAKVREYFVMMDESQKGTITLSELKHVMVEKFHIPDAETREIFHALDSNHDEEIHYSDFLAAMVNNRIALHEDMLKTAFKKFDIDNSGYITQENLKEVLGEDFDGTEVAELLKEADFDHDNKVSYAEFVAYIKETKMEKHQEAGAKVVDGMLKRGNTGEYQKGLENKTIVRKSAHEKQQQQQPENGKKKEAVKEKSTGCCTIS